MNPNELAAGGLQEFAGRNGKDNKPSQSQQAASSRSGFLGMRLPFVKRVVTPQNLAQIVAEAQANAALNPPSERLSQPLPAGATLIPEQPAPHLVPKLSAPAAPAGHAALLGEPAVAGPAMHPLPTPVNSLLLAAIRQQQAQPTFGPGAGLPISVSEPQAPALVPTLGAAGTQSVPALPAVPLPPAGLVNPSGSATPLPTLQLPPGQAIHPGIGAPVLPQPGLIPSVSNASLLSASATPPPVSTGMSTGSVASSMSGGYPYAVNGPTSTTSSAAGGRALTPPQALPYVSGGQPLPSLSQAQLLQLQASAALAALTGGSAATAAMTHPQAAALGALSGLSGSSASAVPGAISSSPPTTMPLPRPAALSVPGAIPVVPVTSAPQAPLAPVKTVKVLLTYGGASTTTSAGAWEYSGGETRLIGGLNPAGTSYAELAVRVESETRIRLGPEGVLRYELPGCPGTLVDVKVDEDVSNMWAEWSEFCTMSRQPTFKLHLYVDRPATPAGGTPRASGGSTGLAGSGSAGKMSADSRLPPDGGSEMSNSARGANTTSSPSSPPPGSPQAASGASGPLLPGGGGSGGGASHFGLPQQQGDNTSAGAAAGGGPASGNAAPAAGQPGTAGAGGSPGAGGKEPSAPTQGVIATFNPQTGTGYGGASDKLALTQTPSQTMSPSLASFDRLLTRVQNTVEIIRPSELRIVRFIGSGGFADCYLAKWLGVDVAVKCFRDMPGGTDTSSRAAVKELLREASTLAALRHPNVLCLYAVALPEKISQLHRLGGVYTTAAPYPYAQAGGAHDDHDHKGGRDGNLQGNHSVGPHHALSHQLSPVLEGNEAEHADGNESALLPKLPTGAAEGSFGGAASAPGTIITTRAASGGSSIDPASHRPSLDIPGRTSSPAPAQQYEPAASAPAAVDQPAAYHQEMMQPPSPTQGGAAAGGAGPMLQVPSQLRAMSIGTRVPSSGASLFTSQFSSSTNSLRTQQSTGTASQPSIASLPSLSASRPGYAPSAPPQGPVPEGMSQEDMARVTLALSGPGSDISLGPASARLAGIDTAELSSGKNLTESHTSDVQLNADNSPPSQSSTPRFGAGGHRPSIDVFTGELAMRGSQTPPTAPRVRASRGGESPLNSPTSPRSPHSAAAPASPFAIMASSSESPDAAMRAAAGAGGRSPFARTGSTDPQPGQTAQQGQDGPTRGGSAPSRVADQLPSAGSSDNNKAPESPSITTPAPLSDRSTSTASQPAAAAARQGSGDAAGAGGERPTSPAVQAGQGSTTPTEQRPGGSTGAPAPLAGARGSSKGSGVSGKASSGVTAMSGSTGASSDPVPDEDEATKRTVAAAEAAAAASADVECQTAVAQGLIQRPALVAEFLSGCSLDSAIVRGADFLGSDLVLAKIALDAARGMEYCHAKRVTHWNLKPGNLMIGFSSDKVPFCKIADIGLSGPHTLCALDEAGVARVLPWAAPELVRNPGSANEKVDIYAFGMILWALWSRRLPYNRHTVAQLFLRTMQGHVVRPPLPGTPEWQALFPGVNPPSEPVSGWAELMQKCWDHDASTRPTFSEVTSSLITMFTTLKSAKRAARAAAAAKGKDGGAAAAAGGGDHTTHA